MFSDNYSKQFLYLPLSVDSVSRRTGEIAEYVRNQLFGKLRGKLFFIQLDGAADRNKDAHFIPYVQFYKGMSAVEELLFCKPIDLKVIVLAYI